MTSQHRHQAQPGIGTGKTAHEFAAEGLALAYDGRRIVDALDLAIPAGKVTVIVGANASGKSTTLKGMARLLRPESGVVSLDGRDIHSMPAKEVARIVGAFGNASLRNVTRLLRDPKGKDERYAWALAHLANHGCLAQVEKLTKESHAPTAAIARQALGLRERAAVIDQQVRGAAPFVGDDPILAFSRRFYQELEGKAPTDELEEGASGLS